MIQKSVLVLGAGRSSSALIQYLITQATMHSWHITVGDISKEAALQRIGKAAVASAIEFNINDMATSKAAIAQSEVVISLLPAHLHPLVAKICLQEKKHLLTASYVSDEMKSFDSEAKKLGLLFLNECGLDPGIDHMSAMQIIDSIKSEDGQLYSFESFTGGLIAPETDPENPWRYKFTWNPRNVIMAGQGTAKYLQDGKFKFIPYQQLFKRITPVVVPGFGEYEGYANRDSLKYLETYGLQGIKTMLRGTLRNKGYCSAWDVLVQLGCCDDTFRLESVSTMTHADFTNSFLESNPLMTVEENLCNQFFLWKEGEVVKRLRWIGLFSDEKIGLNEGTPAQLLEHIFNKKWKLTSGDKDFIVMWHRFRYEQMGKKKEIESYLTVTGESEINTAMAKTVGLPLGIVARLLLQDEIKCRGVIIPVLKEIYEPVLKELNNLGIRMVEKKLD